MLAGAKPICCAHVAPSMVVTLVLETKLAGDTAEPITLPPRPAIFNCTWLAIQLPSQP